MVRRCMLNSASTREEKSNVLVTRGRLSMASFIKISENEMDYYQFKAKAILLQKKEEEEWQEFCKQNASECTDCLGEKEDITESKDVAVQTFPKKLQTPSLRTGKLSVQPKCKGEGTSDAFIDKVDTVMTRLGKIEEQIARLLENRDSRENKNVPQNNVLIQDKPTTQERNRMPFKLMPPSQQAAKIFEEKNLQIQNSLTVHKKSPTVKPKHASFILPHDLEVKKAAARKGYLASLQTKPKVLLKNNAVKKVSFQNEILKKTNINQKAKANQTGKMVSTSKKVLPKSENQKPKQDTEETLMQDIEADDSKDEDVESVVDAIFDDLLGEAAFDLNRIRLKKRGIVNKANLSVPCNLSSASSTKCDGSKFHVNNNNSIMKLKMFIDSSDMIPEENNLRKEPVQLKDKSMSNIENSENMQAKKKAATSTFHKTQEAPKMPPKFICSVKSMIKIDPEKAKNIVSNRDRFWAYLESISRTTKGDINPWILNESLAESILEDCINDIAEELNEMTSTFIQDIYNEEFVQQVET